MLRSQQALFVRLLLTPGGKTKSAANRDSAAVVLRARTIIIRHLLLFTDGEGFCFTNQYVEEFDSIRCCAAPPNATHPTSGLRCGAGQWRRSVAPVSGAGQWRRRLPVLRHSAAAGAAVRGGGEKNEVPNNVAK